MNRSYHIITIGCQMNKSDSERAASYLEANGYQFDNNYNQADLVILNTCGVRQGAEDRIYGLVNQIKGRNRESTIVITGCLGNRPDVKKRLKDRVAMFMPINELPNLLTALEEKKYLNEPRVEVRGLGNDTRSQDYLQIRPKYRSTFSAFVPIGNGCNNFCSYCVVPYARGREVYRPAEEILVEVKDLISQGYKEIILIAQNVNSYHSDDYNFAKLLGEVNGLKGDFWIRFSSSHPKDMGADLIQALADCDRVCDHVHMAVQSGNNKILRLMNRKYSVGHYRKIIRKIRKLKPGVAITTDLIVGFPGETRRQFNDSARLFKRMKYDMAYIAQYSPRYGTVSATMEDNVSLDEKKRREEKLMSILRKTALRNNKRLLGKTVKVLIEGKSRQGDWYGKDSHFKTIKIKDQRQVKDNLTGKFVTVLVDKVENFGLYSRIN